MYGDNESLSTFYKKLRDDYDYEVIVGEDFGNAFGRRDFFANYAVSSSDRQKKLVCEMK